MIGQLPSSPSSIFDHPIVGFDNSKSVNSNENTIVPPNDVKNDKTTQNEEVTDEDKKSNANQKAPHAQQIRKNHSPTLNATWIYKLKIVHRWKILENTKVHEL